MRDIILVDDDAGPIARAIVALANQDEKRAISDNDFPYATLILMALEIIRNGTQYDYD